MKPEQKLVMIDKRMHRCVHFNGVQNNLCEAGVDYNDVTPIPCTGPWKDTVQAKCEKMLTPTREQATAEIEEEEVVCEKTLRAVNAAHADAKAKGLGRGHGGRSGMPCPTGCGGGLNYTVAGVNGHMHAVCTTAGCVRWME